MLTSSAKAKGRALAKWLKHELLKRFHTLGADDISVTSSGTTGGDITLSTAGYTSIPYQWECKNYHRFGVYAHFEQACSHGDREPVLILKANGLQPLAVCRAEHFLDLLKGTNETKI